ncbi:MAG TPA: HU family DNA-binding protein [Spirochaetota bacterium]|nr:integration host factor subunit beta [Spirochaetota bacterium]HNW30385.1 HU family DNA-binding protein [Spirochaetota bacterium]HOD16177.1 HU family DNA-binding protein [Spirochaetota bacterium]HPG51861.1 HU family DNA-binding protein [Spirochaetota bacterium]HPN13090.1 HU family DNA-binding protein [Spirochaetota bacterium]
MTKSDIVDRITRQSGLKKKEVLYIVDNFLEKVKESALKGDRVEIRGFGTFYKAERKARKVFSPIINKDIDVPAKTAIAFRASKITEKEAAAEKGA